MGLGGCSIASRAGSYEGRFVPSPAGVAPTRGVLFHRQQRWLLRGAFCSIASRAGSYEGRFVPSPAGLAPTRGVLFHRQQGWLLRGGILFHRQQGWLLRGLGGLVGGRVSGFGR